MNFDKNKISIIIAILCVFIFGSIYFFSLKNDKIIVAHKNNETEEKNTEELPEQIKEENFNTEKIKIYISGEIKNPDVYELTTEDRIVDAIKMAGGTTDLADLTEINLASYVKDADHIIIPKFGEKVDKSLVSTQNREENNDTININKATEEELKKLPGVGEVTAQNIISYREKNGDFKKIEDIKKVTRIGERTFEQFKELIAIE